MVLHHTLASHERAPSTCHSNSFSWWRRGAPSNPSARLATDVEVVFNINFGSLQLQSGSLHFVHACN
jgi:hypothetical protein